MIHTHIEEIQYKTPFWSLENGCFFKIDNNDEIYIKTGGNDYQLKKYRNLSQLENIKNINTDTIVTTGTSLIFLDNKIEAGDLVKILPYRDDGTSYDKLQYTEDVKKRTGGYVLVERLSQAPRAFTIEYCDFLFAKRFSEIILRKNEFTVSKEYIKNKIYFVYGEYGQLRLRMNNFHIFEKNKYKPTFIYLNNPKSIKHLPIKFEIGDKVKINKPGEHLKITSSDYEMNHGMIETIRYIGNGDIITKENTEKLYSASFVEPYFPEIKNE